MAESLHLTSEGSRIRIGGGFSISDFRRITATLHNVVDVRGYQDVILDFGDCTFSHAPPMVALICDCLRYRHAGITFELRGPTNIELNRLFRNSNWANLIDPDGCPPSEYAPTKHCPATQFRTATEQDLVVNKVMDTLLASIPGFSRPHFRAIEWALNEIMDNVLVHSRSPCGGIVQVTALKNRKRVEFVVGDCGIGIAASLRESSRDITSDVDALSKAIREGVTRDQGVGQGNGLYGTYRVSILSSGIFHIHSNRATLYFAERDGMHSKAEQVPFHGSVVTCGIGYADEHLLADALTFGDVPFEPVDRIQLKYETDQEGVIKFLIRDETDSVGSRVAGTPVRIKLLNLIRMTSFTAVVVDFQETGLISSSFADEVFGKIFVEIGPLEFAKMLHFRNLDPTVKNLIDRAIMQRVSLQTSR